MSHDNNELQSLVDRIRAGDHQARRQLLDRAGGRLRRLAAHILNNSFPAIAARHELDSVVHETWLRLAQALDTLEVASVEHFFHLAAQKVRQVLLDMVQRQRRYSDREHNLPSKRSGPSQHTYDPQRLAFWTELHERIAALPDSERTVFEMHYYLDLTQAEIASTLRLSPRQVSRLWIAATERLGDALSL